MFFPSPPNSGSMGSAIKCIGIAKELRSRGNEVAFVMGGSVADLIMREHFRVYQSPIPVAKMDIRDINSANDFFDWTGMTEYSFLRMSVKAEVEAIYNFKPDVLFSETRLSTPISAHITGVPLISIASWPCSPDFPLNVQTKGRNLKKVNELLEQYNMTPIESLTELIYRRSDIKLAPTIPLLEPELQYEEDIIYTGYLLDLKYRKEDIPPWLEKTKKDSRIFIYPSVGAMFPELYTKVFKETFEGGKYQVICACGYHKSLKYLPANTEWVKFVHYIPAPAVLERSILVIFHGGQDSMLSTLLYGIPSIVVPGRHFEREYNANNLVRTGAAMKLPVYGFRKNRLLSAIYEVLSGSYRDKSRELSLTLKSYGGVGRCIDIIESI